ncbi:MAG: 1-deoxy-D-xylulose-5-phosphate reductoisomerase, partial [Lachnospiraceae bacterium]|nr:1-deoxy-D-xylulose-5-phosphate reductoisomerase [Lachnospiraceae bacterium]
MEEKKKISILGSTGSIGTQTLDVVRANKDIDVLALAAGSNIDLLEKQIEEFNPEVVCVYNEEKALELENRIKGKYKAKVLSGMEGLISCAAQTSAKTVVTAFVGMIGIRPTIEAIKAGKDIAFANKETLVTAGHIIMPLAKKMGVNILPVDSEHSAIFQSLAGNSMNKIHLIHLTASGGPFRGRRREELKNVTLGDALKHPNWSMGKKITVDSSTMVNKGLEVMEAKWLFDVEPSQIQVLIQPKSIIHSMVEYEDGAVIAQLGSPDMKLPIQYALYYPERRGKICERLNFYEISKIEFFKPDNENFPALPMAYEALSIGGSMPTVY